MRNDMLLDSSSHSITNGENYYIEQWGKHTFVVV